MQRLLFYVKSSSSKTHILICQNWCECVLYFGLSNMQTQWDVCRKWTMMTSSNGNIFPRYWPFVRGIHRWIPRTNASDAELWCFLWSAPEWRLSKHSCGWWFETPWRPLWRPCNALYATCSARRDMRHISDPHKSVPSHNPGQLNYLLQYKTIIAAISTFINRLTIKLPWPAFTACVWHRWNGVLFWRAYSRT